MSSDMHLHELSGLGKTEYHTHGYGIQILVATITTRVISTNTLELPK